MFFSRVCSLPRLATCVLLLAACGPQLLQAAPILSAVYDPVTGNITMVATENGSPAALSIATFQFLSPDLLLSGSAASIPSSATSFATVLNTDTSTLVDPPSVHAEIYATNFGGGTPLFTGTWDLGNVAALGLTQSQLTLGFATVPDVSPGGLSFPGSFLYQVQGEFEFQVGQIAAVPEPSAWILLASACAAGGLRWSRRRWRS
jgi:hypothetical protein